MKANSEKERASLLCVKALASRGRLDTVLQQMAFHPQYLERFLHSQHYILHMDGPLPLPYRHYIAIMVRVTLEARAHALSQHARCALHRCALHLNMHHVALCLHPAPPPQRRQHGTAVATWHPCTRLSFFAWGGTPCGFRGWKPPLPACDILTTSTKCWPTDLGSAAAPTSRYPPITPRDLYSQPARIHTPHASASHNRPQAIVLLICSPPKKMEGVIIDGCNMLCLAGALRSLMTGLFGAPCRPC